MSEINDNPSKKTYVAVANQIQTIGAGLHARIEAYEESALEKVMQKGTLDCLPVYGEENLLAAWTHEGGAVEIEHRKGATEYGPNASFALTRYYGPNAVGIFETPTILYRQERDGLHSRAMRITYDGSGIVAEQTGSAEPIVVGMTTNDVIEEAATVLGGIRNEIAHRERTLRKGS